MAQGKVIWFNVEKGYGFIGREPDKDLFVHHSAVLQGPLKKGDLVEYELGESPQGKACAKNVTLIQPTQQEA